MTENVLKASKGWIIATLVCALIFIIPISFGEYYFISNIFNSENEAAIPDCLAMQLIFIPFLLLSICGLLQIFRSYLIIRENEFEYYSGLFKHLTISEKQIKSWSVTKQYSTNFHITYITASGKEKNLKIEMVYKDTKIFADWLNEHFEQGDLYNINKRIEEEIQNENDSFTARELTDELVKYTNIAKYYKRLGILLAILPLPFFLIFKPGLWLIQVSFIINYIYSFAGFFLIKKSKEIIRIDDFKGQKYPSIFNGLLIGPGINMLWSLACIEQIVNNKKYFLVSTLACILFVAIMRLFNFNQLNISKKKKGEIFSIVCFYLIFIFIIFCNVSGVNQYFCISKNSENFKVTVVEKKGDDDFIVSGWPYSDKTKRINVSKSTFNEAEIGDEMKIYIHKGLLGIEFFKYHLIK